MFLRKSFNKTTNRTYLSIVQGYRDKDGKSKSKVVESIGYLDELLKDYEDPITHFTEIAAIRDKERQSTSNITVTIDINEQIERGGKNRKNYGHVVFSKVYHELEIDCFLKNARRHENFLYNTDAIMRLLVYSRLLYPGSKRASVFNKERFFDNFKFSLEDVYNALTHFDKISNALQQHLHEKITEQYGRKTDIVYYDVTNYYFEIDKQDDLRKNGPSKENRKKPIVQMGLMLDKLNLPIMYKIFPGNTHDSQTLMPMLTEIKKSYGARRIITVADKGPNSGDNIAYSMALGDGYIYSKSIRGASGDFKEWAVDETGYLYIKSKDKTENTNENKDGIKYKYKLKSKIVPDAEINVTVEQNGKKKKKKKIKIEQKWIVFYSKKYAERAKHKREETIEKAIKMISNPSQYKRNIDYGAAGYIENIKIDKDSGEIINTEDILVLNQDKIDEEEKYDGYYAIVTSEFDDTDEKTIDRYRELWHIEDTFKITKSVLDTRPIYLSNFEHINAHFLTCFVSLLIARIVERRLEGKYTIARISETLRNVSCSHLEQNVWLFDFADDVTDEINAVFGTGFGRKVMTLQEIKSNLAQSKK